MDIWNRLQNIIDKNRIVIDRPAGSAHPRYENMIYPLDYGYISGTTASDGNCIDVWKGRNSEGITAIGVTVDSFKNDSEIKVFIDCSHEEIEIVRNFMNSEFMSILIYERTNVD